MVPLVDDPEKMLFNVTRLVVVTALWLGLGLAGIFPLGYAADPTGIPEPSMPQYKQRTDHAPRARIGGQSRGSESGEPQLIALVPDHVAFTITGDPSLCWYLSAPTVRPVIITVVDSRGIRPILERVLPSPVTAGIHCTRPRREYGIEFNVQEPYRWFVTLVLDSESPSQDVVSGGMIERVSFDEACALDMPCSWTTCNREAIYRYSEAGLWYDAISCLLELIKQGDDKDAFQRMLHHLLSQTGVHLPG